MVYTMEKHGVLKENNAGLVLIAVAATPTLVHTMPTSIITTARIRKVTAYNGAGVNTLLQLGTLSLAAVWAQRLPSILCVAGFPTIWTGDDLLNFEFVPDTTLVTGTLGNIMAQISAWVAGNFELRLEVEEIRQ